MRRPHGQLHAHRRERMVRPEVIIDKPFIPCHVNVQVTFGLWVPESRRTSCDLLILVEEPAEAVVSFDLVDLGCCATGEWS